MGRPSVKEERAELILNAFEACVAKYGVEGATLQKIADEAGLARALLRHHIGNREELLNALVDRFLIRSDDALVELIEALPDDNRLEALIDILFDQQYASSTSDVLVAEALIAASQTRPDLKERMLVWYQRFDEVISQEAKLAAPKAGTEAVSVFTAGVIGIYFNVDSFGPLGGIPKLREHSRLAALSLMNTLLSKD